MPGCFVDCLRDAGLGVFLGEEGRLLNLLVDWPVNGAVRVGCGSCSGTGEVVFVSGDGSMVTVCFIFSGLEP